MNTIREYKEANKRIFQLKKKLEQRIAKTPKTEITLLNKLSDSLKRQ